MGIYTWMSHEEIYKSYKSAEQPKRQIEILCDLNATSRDKIIKIIEEQEVVEKERKAVLKQAKTKYNIRPIMNAGGKDAADGEGWYSKHKIERKENIQIPPQTNTDIKSEGETVMAIHTSTTSAHAQPKKEAVNQETEAVMACIKQKETAIENAREAEKRAQECIEKAKNNIQMAEIALTEAETAKKEAQKAEAAIKILKGKDAQ